MVRGPDGETAQSKGAGPARSHPRKALPGVSDANEDLHEELAAFPVEPSPRAAGELRALCDALAVRERSGDRVALSLRDIRLARRMTALLGHLGRPVRVFALRCSPSGPRATGSIVRLTWDVPTVDPGSEAGRRRVAWHEGYLAGATLVAGYLAEPLRGYSLEWNPARSGRERLAHGIVRSLRKLGIAHGTGPGRRGGTRVYVKGGDAVGLVLRHVGVVDSIFRWEDARSMRSMRGQIHRAVNGETANLARSARAGARQAQWARQVLASGRASELSPALQEVVRLRAARPEASLAELADTLGVARSSAYGRLRRVEAWGRGQGLFGEAPMQPRI